MILEDFQGDNVEILSITYGIMAVTSSHWANSSAGIKTQPWALTGSKTLGADGGGRNKTQDSVAASDSPHLLCINTATFHVPGFTNQKCNGKLYNIFSGKFFPSCHIPFSINHSLILMTEL